MLNRFASAIFLALVAFSANSAFAGESYRCEVAAFGRIYAASGSSENEARAMTRVSCAGAEDPMFCTFGKMSCTRYVRSEFYCEIVAFNRLYWSRADQLMDARQTARNQCLRTESSIFCAESKVSCLAL